MIRIRDPFHKMVRFSPNDCYVARKWNIRMGVVSRQRSQFPQSDNAIGFLSVSHTKKVSRKRICRNAVQSGPELYQRSRVNSES